MNNIFVGNLSFKATKEDVVKLFGSFGSVANVIILEGKKGKSRGYGFVDMPNEEEKNAAIAALAGKEFMWRVLSVSPVVPKIKGELKPKESRPAKKEWKSLEAGSKPFRKAGRRSKAWVKSQSTARSPRGDFKPAKPWQKNKSNAKSTGFKMSHKVSGIPKPLGRLSP